MAILNYTTSVNASKTAGEIQGILAKHGATQVTTLYRDGAPTGIAFTVGTDFGPRNFELPANVEGVEVVMRKTAPPRYHGKDQARRVAWRILKDWVEAQLAVIQAGMVTLDEVMLPYMLTDTGLTVTAVYKKSESMRDSISSPRAITA